MAGLGCPAIDKGANQPNVFFDPKSAESMLPHFSSGARDDFQQRAFIDAYQRFFDPAHPGFNGSNPLSPVYGGRMLDPEHLTLWAWDARPYPYFPDLTEVWSDGANWERGHWLNGRLGLVSLSGLIEAVLSDHDFADFAVADVYGLVGGYVVNEVLSARATLEPLLQAFRIDAADAGDRILFRGRSRPGDAEIGEDSLVEVADEPLLRRRRAQETELASELVLRFIDAGKDFRMGAAASRGLAGDSQRGAAIDLTAIIEFQEAERLTDTARHLGGAGEHGAAAAAERLVDRGRRPSATGWRAGAVSGRAHRGRREPQACAAARRSARPVAASFGRAAEAAAGNLVGAPEVRAIDFASPDGMEMHAPRLAVFAEPWPGSAAIYAAAEGGGFRLASTLTRAATMGRLVSPLGAGPHGRFDRANAIEVALFGGTLASLPDIDVLAGGNSAAVKGAGGQWEILQFAEAELIAPRRYRLTKLLRGQCGTEAAMQDGAETGADFVLLDRAVAPLPVRRDQVGLPLIYRIGPARDDHAAPSFSEAMIVADGVGLRPLAPVHLKAKRDGGTGDIDLSFVRRTRFGGVAWEAVEIPLNEDSEAYRLEIFDGATLRRSIELAAPFYRYDAAAQVTDFGGPTAAFNIRIAQLSAAAGAGFPLEEIVNA